MVTFPRKYRLVHTVMVKIATGYLKWPITKLAQLPFQVFIYVPAFPQDCSWNNHHQLSCYIFGISIGDTCHLYMCIWAETVAGRRGNEIASCFQVHRQTKTDSMECDNCVGQNKNHMIVFLLLFLVAIGLFEHTEQRFLVSGDSFLPCDIDFAVIE
ncbi:hypothetical protein PR048_013054 [Dryococelus australis]|uniref:DUF7869 domain-containing protein n=1 Tax=Dryococelus australis TaxID=614101 RepID=A0ABQ9HR59_9NEOP|nr:hypothetical protein PR048_013054 [Dryococelus australis]